MKLTTGMWLRLVILGCVIPFVLSTIAYQGFSTNYTTGVFSRGGFEDQYQSGIYKYRVLGRVLLLRTYDLVRSYRLPVITTLSLTVLDKNADPQFYSAYFYLNTFFLCLASMVLFVILAGHRQSTDFMTVDLPILFICAVITMTQYVVVPYDTLSYFLLAVAALVTVRDRGTWWTAPALCIVVVLAMLTRETAILILAFYVAVNNHAILTVPTGRHINRHQAVLLMASTCFLCTYVGLRIVMGYDGAVYEDFRFSRNLDRFSLLSTAFLASFVVLALITKTAMREIAVFLLAALLYILPMFMIATLWEIRLWTPIVLLLTVIKARAAQLAVPEMLVLPSPRQ